MAVSKRLRFEILRRDNHTCRYCGGRSPDVKLTVDHVTPEALGGRTEPSNLVAACADCNSGKSSASPDAALLGDVAEDAVRWAQAQKVAAAALLADLEQREDRRREFKVAWDNWGSGEGAARKKIPLPIEWPDSVDRFVAAGLPLPVLLDCLGKAMRTPKVTPENTFRYMCGIAWSKVTEMQDGARAGVGAPVEHTGPEITDEWAALLDEALEEVDRDDIARYSAASISDDDPPVPPGQVTVQVACSTISYLSGDLYFLLRSVRRLLGQLPSEEAAEYLEYARRKLTRLIPGDWGGAHEAGVALTCVAAKLAAKRLARFPEQERNEWFACAAASGPADDDYALVVTASEYAWRYMHEGRVPRGMCTGPGEHGARCPRRATYRAWFEDCRWCAENGESLCSGHSYWCDTHMEQVIDGKLGSPDAVINYEAIPNNDPWAG